MSEIHLAVKAALAGQIGLPLLGVLFLVVFQVWDLNRRVKDHVPIHRHVYTVVKHTPIHIYSTTDWKDFGEGMVTFLIIGPFIGILVTIFVVGVMGVFL